MKCSVVVCTRPATWEGVLSIIERQEFSIDVAYCDGHAFTQVNSVPDGLRLSLIPRKRA